MPFVAPVTSATLPSSLIAVRASFARRSASVKATGRRAGRRRRTTRVLKIGRLLDHPTTAGTLDYGRAAIELVLDEVNGSGGVGGQPITMVDADGVGSVERVIAGARALAAEGCLAILGPSGSGFAVPKTPGRAGIRAATANWTGSGLARGAWGFQRKIGSLPDEAGSLTRLIAARRDRGVAVVRDRGPIGDEYAAFLRAGLDSLGVAVAADLAMADAVAATACVGALPRPAPTRAVC